MAKSIFPPLVVICVFSVIQASAQQKLIPPPLKSETLNFADTVRTQEKVTELGIVLGGLYYLGDLTDNKLASVQELEHPAGGIFVRRHLTPNLALRANLLTGRLKSSDQAHPERNFSFTTSLHEASLQVEWDIFGKHRYRHVDTLVYNLNRYTQIAEINKFHRVLLPYLFVGGAAIMSTARPSFDNNFIETNNRYTVLQKDKDQGAGFHTNYGITFGGGLTFDLGKKWALGAEVGARTAFDDFLDGISYTANPSHYDWYWLVGLNLCYRFGVNDADGDGTPDKLDKCPDTPGMGRTKGCPDADNDGIPDFEDECPRVVGIASLAGCPVKDADNDGVPDVDDLCPKVPGLAEFKGCPDTDGDGIEDKLDTCLTVAGLAQFHGCPDTDGDGIEDRFDACPKEKGVAEYYKGCPVRDTDKDGVEDKLDECLTVAGKPEFKGCPDTDNDGVEDRVDVCPTTAGKPENKGCPVVEKKDLDKLKLAVKAVKFESGKTILKPESNKILQEIVDVMNKYPDYLLKIEGHTDNVGKDEKNQALSEGRAKTCADFLITKGVKAERIQSAGFGKTQPVADNKTANGRAQNRRVEFNLYLPEKK